MKADSVQLKRILNEHSIWVLSLGKSGNLADFKNWNLDEVSLEMANLPFAKLDFASLKNANLSGANFRQAELLRVRLKNSNLDGADFEGANMAGADLSFSKCTGANFCDANLEGADFEGAYLENANFTRAILRGATFKNADLSFAEMVDANIQGADFKGAQIETTLFGGANLDAAIFEKTSLKVFDTRPHLSAAQVQDTGNSESTVKIKKSPKAGIDNQKFDKSGFHKSLNLKSAKKEDFVVDPKSVNPEKIEAAVANLINQVKSDIPVDQVKARCKQQPDIEKIATVDFVRGDIITHDDRVAFKLDYKISYKLSLLLDRKGNLIMDYPDRLEKP
ncbi:MAG: pentapeptide repeat-containing protein [Deltaproteobacteria bacterium]|nr:pentapeptide repeat-containing protein [Deltaproteobacteria bacterium]